MKKNGEVNDIKKEELLDIRWKGHHHPMITRVKFLIQLLDISSLPQTLLYISLEVS